ncbi:hypothetical protein M231_06946 [Tremella mesenterica]|uniref:Uncharacterized protein n=1 Tax=Tremella mesenterica TaxID=5217 RepID=A0A4Q1BCL9_TREME|nr:hypothetical protein M231_06946 [Tremella mesenterica]
MSDDTVAIPPSSVSGSSQVSLVAPLSGKSVNISGRDRRQQDAMQMPLEAINRRETEMGVRALKRQWSASIRFSLIGKGSIWSECQQFIIPDIDSHTLVTYQSSKAGMILIRSCQEIPSNDRLTVDPESVDHKINSRTAINSRTCTFTLRQVDRLSDCKHLTIFSPVNAKITNVILQCHESGAVSIRSCQVRSIKGEPTYDPATHKQELRLRTVVNSRTNELTLNEEGTRLNNCKRLTISDIDGDKRTVVVFESDASGKVRISSFERRSIGKVFSFDSELDEEKLTWKSVYLVLSKAQSVSLNDNVVEIRDGIAASYQTQPPDETHKIVVCTQGLFSLVMQQHPGSQLVLGIARSAVKTKDELEREYTAVLKLRAEGGSSKGQGSKVSNASSLAMEGGGETTVGISNQTSVEQTTTGSDLKLRSKL